MPYQKGSRLPFERASKTGHIEVIQSPLVNKLFENFENPEHPPLSTDAKWQTLPPKNRELDIIFAADGSIQTIEEPHPPYKAIAFVKTALLKVDQVAIARVDKNNPHPFALRDLMKKSAIFHATAFPLRHVHISDKSVYHTIREIIYESVKDAGYNNAIDGAMMETLKWIAYEKWSPNPKSQLEKFDCPYCRETVATLLFDQEEGNCPSCGGKIFITDLFGLHLSMTEDHAPGQVATDYMSVSETIMIFTPIRYFWENNREYLKRCLMVKDGPLSLRATLAKLSAPIRRFFNYAKSIGIEVAMIGQEKSGYFFDHLQLIGRQAPNNSIFIPNNDYIRNEIQHLSTDSVYGRDTNYGAKIFLKLSEYHKMVLNIPTGKVGEYVENPNIAYLIGFENIISTLPKILSNRYEGALLPIELANGVASLSTYPSARVLEMLADSRIKTG
ncbi:hypothetical protein H8E77_13155 [bacterium]|nr:hypothetical protein [bacterium]